MGTDLPRDTHVRVIASPHTWIEGEALKQLNDVGEWPGMVRCVGMPDLHPGKGGPVGAVFLTDGVLYPTLVGSDVGCGMALWTTDLDRRKARPERVADRLNGLDDPWGGDTAAWLADAGLEPTDFDASLGTVGHGNHFAEVQAIQEINDAARARDLGLDPDRLLLLIHTGSRGLGESLLRRVTAEHGNRGLPSNGAAAIAYLNDHGRAIRWAEANRSLVAHRMMEALSADGERRLDLCHNGVAPAAGPESGCWLHRKGAAPADQGPVVIPGSRGTASYLVEPLDTADDALWSLAHGAGRKLARGEARAKLKARYRRTDMERTRFGGRVVCGDDALLFEEAPEAYKDVDRVVGDLVEAGLVRIVAVLRPLVTFKVSTTTRGCGPRDQGNRRRDRRAVRAGKEQGR